MAEIVDCFADRPIIVGSGLAGLIAALTMSPEPSVLVTRSALGAETSSAWAQGGMSVSLSPDDNPSLHLADTLAAGDGLCDAVAAESIILEALDAFHVLQHFGIHFDQDSNGHLALGLEAAHSRRRIVHVGGDRSGTAIVQALTACVLNDPSITVLEGLEARHILMADNVVCGLLLANPTSEIVLPSSRILLATGGIGGLYDATTNPVSNFGQGIAMAARAGAVLADMEFVQFHPTALHCHNRPLALVSEAVRGEGAVLINERGERFMADIPGAELAARNIVAQAISAEITRGGQVFLDARQALGARFSTRFPTITALCHKVGIDPVHMPIPVCPAAHYHMGGIAIDHQGRSSIPGLWVAGEAASTGLHGANRLASNSLLEAVVMGTRAARDITFHNTPHPLGTIPITPKKPDTTLIRPIVSQCLGVLRHAADMHRAIAALLPFVEGEEESSDPAIVALLIAIFAYLRTESRGAHARTDFPLKHDTTQRRHMTLEDVLEIAHSCVAQRKEKIS
ncbi:L-aspartate oxidase [Xylella fastidiosa]|uniref:L-aspartate oxidase n=1 Tax=Xylella fastidiosa (strain 9a5c) TaxID=160492 RepID=NADB_XYLFA|nr:L-aspartate oxidase [Xylella fastidiosa]Q9PC57.1 RecName: Full=L-aspartate oxidase; Short=LASPO; AltName: Full=Quinolinate synthase B [Xylella fastidiosa 9a5c]AAF84730.1 L-aspartate oxidase [Xylella fastidiosa 9a5c]ALQ95158.1 L-aspartate oxidase [Xylella fastidiosa]ALQ96855.1 L-aspartate oxidase [Xylella fastidiosa]ALR02502.1 L-aspartate oxidase [Xylella fastidiosa]ALR08789.2 L-aspartate oxidase [Xylella fastidiosa]